MNRYRYIFNVSECSSLQEIVSLKKVKESVRSPISENRNFNFVRIQISQYEFLWSLGEWDKESDETAWETFGLDGTAVALSDSCQLPVASLAVRLSGISEERLNDRWV